MITTAKKLVMALSLFGFTAVAQEPPADAGANTPPPAASEAPAATNTHAERTPAKKKSGKKKAAGKKKHGKKKH